jgi:hypothetical protein
LLGEQNALFAAQKGGANMKTEKLATSELLGKCERFLKKLPEIEKDGRLAHMTFKYVKDLYGRFELLQQQFSQLENTLKQDEQVLTDLLDCMCKHCQNNGVCSD